MTEIVQCQLGDECDRGADGSIPHRARFEGLTELAIERASEIPKAWERRGRALLATIIQSPAEIRLGAPEPREWVGPAPTRRGVSLPAAHL